MPLEQLHSAMQAHQACKFTGRQRDPSLTPFEFPKRSGILFVCNRLLASAPSLRFNIPAVKVMPIYRI